MWYDNIKFNHNTCVNMDGVSYPIEDNNIALYVVMTRKCNVNCKFCDYHKGVSNIDIDYFKKIYDEITKYCHITTIHFTGGEPSLELEKVKQICEYAKTKDKYTKTSINTNGSNLYKLTNIDTLDNISLSRHHYIDEKNQCLFDSTLVPTRETLQNFTEKEKLHLSCNLVKGYIDCKEEVQRYLDFAAEIGINDIGLVSLMQINQFSTQNFVDFNQIHIEKIENLKKTRCFCKKDKDIPICRCDNYLYLTKMYTLLSVYHRYAIKNSSIADYLVYDNNILRQGFTGQIIV